MKTTLLILSVVISGLIYLPPTVCGQDVLGKLIVQKGKAMVRTSISNSIREVKVESKIYANEFVRISNDSKAYVIINGVVKNVPADTWTAMSSFNTNTEHRSYLQQMSRLIEMVLLPQNSTPSLIHKGNDNDNNSYLNLLQPHNTTILITRPEFKWDQSQSNYLVSLHASSGNQDLIWQVNVNKANLMIFPADKNDLINGTEYLWEVKDLNNNDNKSSGNFRIADIQTINKVRNELNDIKNQCNTYDIPYESCILAQVGIYLDHNCIYEAERLLIKAIKEHPENEILVAAISTLAGNK